MKKTSAMNASRRAFLQRGSALLSAGITSPLALNLATIAEASAATATDYKAIVCIFLHGGNDYANTLVPYDTSNYNNYQKLRPTLAIARNNLAATALSPRTSPPVDRNGVPHQYALAPSLAPLMPIFNSGRMGVLLNVGSLIEPTTKTQFENATAHLPPKLFSHNDQQSFWQSLAPEGAPSGWGGRIGDMLQSGNGRAVFTCINVAQNNPFLTGKIARQYQISSNGAIPFGNSDYLYGSKDCAVALKTLITQPRTHLLENELNLVMQRSLNAGTDLNAALASAPFINTPFAEANDLADQLKIVARTISSANTLGVKRQIFFVSMYGFDNHDGLPDKHPALLANVASAMKSFYDATVELGVSNQVTAFTASDFGRSLSGNNDGSDHGWGSMQFVMGGAVLGQSFYGTAPLVADDSLDDVGEGRLIPTTSVDQYAATLGKWMGVSDSDLLTALPNLKNFSTRNLGFMV